ncbi:hypothetical protein ACFQZQ_03120 [Lysobacter koreensis]|uniref:Uncharacterized protein n=1 Tax=Lysobacter koreensis TaxID=266122 RepID=A0ABW2YKB8_9GAMM
MSAPVDVLAVMGDAECRWRLVHETTKADAMAEARAAVAELIAADREYDAAKVELATQRRQVGAVATAEVRWHRAVARRAASLARIGGAK